MVTRNTVHLSQLDVSVTQLEILTVNIGINPSFGSIMAAMFNNPSDKELKNLHDCITANPVHGNPEYYKDNRSEEDTEMINEYHVGWITIEKNY